MPAVLPREYDPELRPERLAPLDLEFTKTDGTPISLVPKKIRDALSKSKWDEGSGPNRFGSQFRTLKPEMKGPSDHDLLEPEMKGPSDHDLLEVYRKHDGPDALSEWIEEATREQNTIQKERQKKELSDAGLTEDTFISLWRSMYGDPSSEADRDILPRARSGGAAAASAKSWDGTSKRALGSRGGSRAIVATKEKGPRPEWEVYMELWKKLRKTGEHVPLFEMAKQVASIEAGDRAKEARAAAARREKARKAAERKQSEAQARWIVHEGEWFEAAPRHTAHQYTGTAEFAAVTEGSFDSFMAPQRESGGWKRVVESLGTTDPRARPQPIASALRARGPRPDDPTPEVRRSRLGARNIYRTSGGGMLSPLSRTAGARMLRDELDGFEADASPTGPPRPMKHHQVVYITLPPPPRASVREARLGSSGPVRVWTAGDSARLGTDGQARLGTGDVLLVSTPASPGGRAANVLRVSPTAAAGGGPPGAAVGGEGGSRTAPVEGKAAQIKMGATLAATWGQKLKNRSSVARKQQAAHAAAQKAAVGDFTEQRDALKAYQARALEELEAEERLKRMRGGGGGKEGRVAPLDAWQSIQAKNLKYQEPVGEEEQRKLIDMLPADDEHDLPFAPETSGFTTGVSRMDFEPNMLPVADNLDPAKQARLDAERERFEAIRRKKKDGYRAAKTLQGLRRKKKDGYRAVSTPNPT
ncbi:hypothetical protein T484DRAFT_1851311 [Baffinella frigidus]|nr:hypothetical protein T484DRAFT_1851311 [Cryptophyta sp. CCMP2293]